MCRGRGHRIPDRHSDPPSYVHNCCQSLHRAQKFGVLITPSPRPSSWSLDGWHERTDDGGGGEGGDGAPGARGEDGEGRREGLSE